MCQISYYEGNKRITHSLVVMKDEKLSNLYMLCDSSFSINIVTIDTKFGRSEKIDYPVYYSGLSGFDSFRVKLRKELNSNMFIILNFRFSACEL
jgi:hypothetical protein